jgi:hypothetical protein
MKEIPRKWLKGNLIGARRPAGILHERAVSMSKLSHKATIADIISTLNKPVEYVRGVFGNMVDCKKEHGNAFVRIGKTGRGISPHYRVEPELSPYAIDDAFDPIVEFTAFDGRNHKKLDWEWPEVRGHHWSSETMSYEEVQNLLGSLRNFKRK